MDQIYKTSFFRIRGKEKNWKKKRKLLKLRLRGFETLKSIEIENRFIVGSVQTTKVDAQQK